MSQATEAAASSPPAEGVGAPTDCYARGDGLNLRMWFASFIVCLTALTLAALWGMSAMDGSSPALGWGVWVFAGYAFYLALCCTFFPAPTTWVVMFAASDMVAAQIGLEHYAWLRVAIVATIGAAATGLANLNEYHIFAYLLRKRRVAKFRETRFFRKASDWFHAGPFWILTLFSFLPIPVDVIRWLAITARYSRGRFFAASFLGRWFRYAIWALAAVGLELGTWQIVTVQVVLGALALLRVLIRVIGRRRGGDGETPHVVATGRRA